MNYSPNTGFIYVKYGETINSLIGRTKDKLYISETFKINNKQITTPKRSQMNFANSLQILANNKQMTYSPPNLTLIRFEEISLNKTGS